MQPSASITMPVSMAQARRHAAANEQMDNPAILCQFPWFGREVSFLKQDALHLFVGIPVTVVVAMSIYQSLPDTLSGYAAMAIGVVAGSAAGSVAGYVAQKVYVRCRQIAPTDLPVQLSRITSHAPEPTETFSEAEPINYSATFRYPQGSPPTYTQEEPQLTPPPVYTQEPQLAYTQEEPQSTPPPVYTQEPQLAYTQEEPQSTPPPPYSP